MKNLVLDPDLEHRTNLSIISPMSIDLMYLEMSNLRELVVIEKETHTEAMMIEVDLSGTHTEMPATTSDSMPEISKEILFRMIGKINTITRDHALL